MGEPNGVSSSQGQKHSLISEAHSQGKAVVLSAESFAHTHSSLHRTIDSQADTIQSLANSIKLLEQQVKGIARVLATQNIGHLSDKIKMVQDDLTRSFQADLNEKEKNIMEMVEREVAEVTGAKGSLLRKINQVETQVMTTVVNRLDDLAQDRRNDREELEKFKEELAVAPAIANKNSKLISNIEMKVLELKNDMRTLERENQAANSEQDRQTMALTSEIRTELTLAKEKLAEDSKVLAKSIHKKEQLLRDEVKGVMDHMEVENNKHVDKIKAMQRYMTDEFGKSKAEHEKRIVSVEGSITHQVKPFAANFREIKRLIEEESVHRDQADKDLARRIVLECQERHQDEERLVSLIQVCQSAVGKLSKGTV